MDPHFRMGIITADPDDNKFVDCAFAAGADYLVSEDNGFRKLRISVGNSQMYDSKAMDEALLRSTRYGYITISTFMHYSGLKSNSAKISLDSLCKGEHPRLSRHKEGRM